MSLVTSSRFRIFSFSPELCTLCASAHLCDSIKNTEGISYGMSKYFNVFLH